MFYIYILDDKQTACMWLMISSSHFQWKFSLIGLNDVVHLLIQKGADVNALNNDNDSALTLATERGT